MNSTLNYIDDYFTGALSDTEKRDFEQRCAFDEAFAKEVAEYVNLRDALAAHLREEKKAEFAKLYQQVSAPEKTAKIITLKRTIYFAAASVLLVIGLTIFFQPPASQKIADKYISDNLTMLSVNMGRSDSLQEGISAYNSKSYIVAEHVFTRLTNNGELTPEAVKYLGLAQLAMKQYDEAIKNFDKLSAMNLHINPGQFYKALALMERSQGDDNVEAKKVLQEIIDKNLYGNQQARNWIKQI